MGHVLFALVRVLNFGISVWNAYAVGKVWVEARHENGWHRFLCWMGAIMSASGFTWCYLSFLVLTASYFQWVTEQQALLCLDLGYVLLVPFVLFAGYAIAPDSWVRPYRQGGFLNYGVAAWNTYAASAPGRCGLSIEHFGANLLRRSGPERAPRPREFLAHGGPSGLATFCVSSSASSFWKPSRRRSRSKSGSFSSSNWPQPAPTAPRKAATAWSANSEPRSQRNSGWPAQAASRKAARRAGRPGERLVE